MNSDISASERLIVALDVDSKEKAERLIKDLVGCVSFFKINWQLLLRVGLPFVRKQIKRGNRIFLDLKIDDIPETIKLAVETISYTGVDFLTIHGNGITAKSAIAGRANKDKPKLLSLTFLSSLDQQDLNDLFLSSELKLKDYILWKATTILDHGVDGLIASGDSVAWLREKFRKEKPLIVTPGIRPLDFPKNDHKRSLTPGEAIRLGADYLVVGRPIRDSSDPRKTAEMIIQEMEEAFESVKCVA